MEKVNKKGNKKGFLENAGYADEAVNTIDGIVQGVLEGGK